MTNLTTIDLQALALVTGGKKKAAKPAAAAPAPITVPVGTMAMTFVPMGAPSAKK